MAVLINVMLKYRYCGFKGKIECPIWLMVVYEWGIVKKTR